MLLKKTNNKKQDLPKTIDNQLVEWRKKFNKEIPERVGLAFYTNEKGQTEVEVYFADNNMWLSQATMAELFDVSVKTISEHIDNVYNAGELEKNPTFRKIRRVQIEGTTTMQQWIEFMNGFMKLNNFPVLEGLGKISKEQADEKALTEYTEFRIVQDRNYIGDFERMMQLVEKSKK